MLRKSYNIVRVKKDIFALDIKIYILYKKYYIYTVYDNTKFITINLICRIY